MKDELFKDEINYIKNPKLKESLKKIINSLPDYWFEVAASSTGKYHPKYALGDGGLLRHSKVAMRMGYELLLDESIGNKYTSLEKDLMLIALLVHDGLKSGLVKEKYTRFDHPILMANFIMDNKDKFDLSDEDASFISDVIKTHMGNYTTDYNGNEVLEKPKTKYQNFVHICDYLASRKFIHIDFDKDNNILEEV